MARRSTFALALGQRLNVPGNRKVQGVIGIPRACDQAEHSPDSLVMSEQRLWFMRWLDDGGNIHTKWFAENEIIDAQAEATETPANPPALNTGRKRRRNAKR